MKPDEIKRLRNRLGLTQKQLAEEVGVPTNTLARWEQGERTPSKSSIKTLRHLERQYLKASRPASEGLGWNKIDNDKTLQRLVNHLVALELNSPGFIPSSPYIGADGGWDGLYKGTYQNSHGLWCIQAKYKKKNLKEAYQSLRKDLLGHGKVMGEISKAQKNGVDYLLIATNAELSVPYITQLASLRRGKIKRIFVWDRERLSQGIEKQPWLRHKFFGNPQAPLFVPISEYFPQIEPDLLPGIIGRTLELDQLLLRLLKEDSKVIIVHAPGGFGKSHFLREVGMKVGLEHREWQSWFARPGFRDCKDAIQHELISGQKYVLFLDDAERSREDLECLVSYAKSFSKTCRLVIGVRSAGLHFVDEVLKGRKVDPSMTIELGELPLAQQVELLIQTANGKKIDNPERIVKALGGVPYLIVNAGRQISATSVEPTSANDIRNKLADDFIDECKLALSDLLDPQKIRDLIVELAVVVPLKRNDEKAKKIIASLLQVDDRTLNSCLNQLEQRKLFRVIGNALRFRADMLGDLVLSSRATESNADEFVRSCLERWLETKPENVITNLAAAARGDQEGAPHRVIQQLIREWIFEADKTPTYEQRSRLKVLQPAIYLAPEHALDLISAYANSSPDASDEISRLIGPTLPPNMDDYGPLLVNIARIPGYPVRVARLTLTLVRINLGGMYANYKPDGLFSSLVDPFTHLIEDIKNVIDHLYKTSVEENADCCEMEAFLSAATTLLAGTHEYTDSYEDQFTFGQRAIPAVQPVLEYRKFTLDRLVDLLRHPRPESRSLVVNAIRKHGAAHPSIGGDIPLRDEIAKERASLMSALRNLLADEKEIIVLSSVENLLIHWWATELEEPLTSELLELLDEKRTALYSTYRYFVAPNEAIDEFKSVRKKAPKKDRWSWWVKNRRDYQALENMLPLAKQICAIYPTSAEKVDFLISLEGLIAPLNPWANPPIIEAIHSLDREFCSSVRKNQALWEKVPERFKAPIDRILSEGGREHIALVASEVLSKRGSITRQDVSRFFSSLNSSKVGDDKKAGWINEIIEVGNSDALSEVAAKCGWIVNDSVYLVPLLTKLFDKSEYEAFHSLDLTIHKLIRDGVSAGVSLDDLKKAIRERIILKPKLDYHDADLTEFAFDGNSDTFFDCLTKRLAYEGQTAKRRVFEAIPFNGFEKTIDKFVSTEEELEYFLTAAYQLEKENSLLQFSINSLLGSVLYKSFGGEKPYIIKSCEQQLAQSNYMDVRKELWWRLGKLRIAEGTIKLFSSAIQAAEKNGLFEDDSKTLWRVIMPHKWSGSMREIPPQYVKALELARKLKQELPQGKGRNLVEQIEQGILKDIEGIKQEHEEFLNQR